MSTNVTAQNISSYFNRYKFLISFGNNNNNIDSLPKNFHSVLFDYNSFSHSSDNIFYEATIEDPVINFIQSLQKFNLQIYSHIIIRKINDHQALVYSHGLVPTHHMLRIHDILVRNGFNTTLFNKPSDDPFVFDFDSKDLYKNIIKCNEETINYDLFIEDKKLKKELQELDLLFSKSSDDAVEKLLIFLYNSFTETYRISLKIFDDKWNCQVPTKETKKFLDESEKLISMTGAINLLARFEGGLVLKVNCPISKLLIANNIPKKKCLLDEYEMRGNQQLYDHNNLVPFWMKIYLAESLRDKGFSVELDMYFGRKPTFENFIAKQIRSFNSETTGLVNDIAKFISKYCFVI